jgi:Putative zinc-finger
MTRLVAQRLRVGAFTCDQAERAISLRLDGRLPRSAKRPLRAHLCACPECDGFDRSQQAQRPVWQTLADISLPASLQSFFGPGGVLARAGGVTISVG